jgi:RNA polymerase sigma-54 factor
MQLNLSQQMRMSQQMKLAPRMIQSMEILQLPILALDEKIEQELQENICLERISSDPNEPRHRDEVAEAQLEATEKPIAERELVVDGDGNGEADFERLLEMSS